LLAEGSGDSKSKHFNDQAAMYRKGNLKMFYLQEDVKKMPATIRRII
jgi:hypothetical protein